MKPIPEIDSLPWSEPRTVGAAKYLMKSAPPSEAFWTLYRRYKEALKEAGIGCSAFKDVWSVNWWARDGVFHYPVLPELPSLVHRELDIQPLVNEKGLKGFQIPLTAHMVAAANENDTINGSGTGVGKTFITCVMQRERKRKFLVICPKTITVDWKRAATLMDAPLLDAFGWEWIKTGKTPYGYWDMTPPRKKGGKSTRDKFNWTLPEGVELILDEAHRASGNGTQNSHIVERAKAQGIRIHALSATLANDPTKLRAIGFVLGLHDGTKEGFEEFMRTYGCQLVKMPIPAKGQKRASRDEEDEEGSGNQRSIQVWKFRGTQRDLKALHSNIFPHKGVRVKPEDLGDAFPQTLIDAKAYEIEEAKEITKAYEEMMDRIAEIEADDEMEGSSKPANILAEMMRARKRVEWLKVNLMVSLTRDALEEGMSVFLAVNFRETIFGKVDDLTGNLLPGLQQQLKIRSLIVGGQKDIERRNAIDDFQADKERIACGIIQACREGISLHDLNGKYPRRAYIMPSQSAIDIKQVLGRVWRAGGLTRSIQSILFAANTIEESVAKNLASKLDQLDLIMDGNLNDGIFPGKYSYLRPKEVEQGVLL